MVAPAGRLEVNYRVGAERRPHIEAGIAVAQRAVVLERRRRRVGGAQHLDVEALEQGPRGELGFRQAPFNLVVDTLCAFRCQLFVDAKNLVELAFEPQSGRRSPKQVEMVGEALPDAAVVGLHRRAVASRHAKVFQRHALAVQHPEHIMVRNDKQIGGRAEAALRFGQQRGVDMAVRADDRQIAHSLVQLARDGTLGRVGIKAAIGG